MAVLEEVLRYHGDPGKCQLILWFLILFTLFHMGMIQQFNIIMTYVPEHKCKIPSEEWSTKNQLIFNGTKGACQIHAYSNSSDDITEDIPCPEGWEYKMMENEIFPSQEFDMVCSQGYLLTMAVAVTFIGVMLGGLVFGLVADHFGRQRSMAFIVTALSIINTSVYFSPSYDVFVALRFFLGIFSQGLQTCCLAYGSELFLPRMRTLTSSAVGLLWSLMLPLLSLLMYLLGHWRLVHLFMGVMSLISGIYVWFLPESVPWLLNRDKVDTAVEVLNSYAKRNGIPPMPSLRDDLQRLSCSLQRKRARNSAEAKCSNLLRTPTLRRITFSLLYIWFTTACVTFGLSFSISGLKGNIYITYTATGFLEFILRVIIMYVFFIRFGRKPIMSIIIFSCGILTVGGYLAKYFTPESFIVVHYVVVGAAVVGRNLIALNFTLLCIYTAEIFPTNLRSTGIGLGFAVARFGIVITPFILFYLRTKVWDPLPQIIYGSMAILAGAVMLTLPETFNRPLPTCADDVEDLAKGRSFRSSVRLTNHTGDAVDGEKMQNLINENDNGYSTKPL